MFEILFCYYFYQRFYNYTIKAINVILLSNPNKLIIALLLNCLSVKVAIVYLSSLLGYLELQNLLIIKEIKEHKNRIYYI